MIPLLFFSLMYLFFPVLTEITGNEGCTQINLKAKVKTDRHTYANIEHRQQVTVRKRQKEDMNNHQTVLFSVSVLIKEFVLVLLCHVFYIKHLVGIIRETWSY